MKRVILTGATGLIGKEAIKPLIELGFEIHALTTKDINSGGGIKWIKCDIFDEDSVKEVFKKIKPTHLLHFAWATTGDYLTSNINFDFLIASLSLLKYFKENNGKRAVFAGTCFEYEFKDEPLKEDDTLNPQTVYAKCKNYLRELAELYCENNDISFGWGRIFYVYGHGESEKRLTAHIIKSFSQNKEVVINSGYLIRDYMYTKDIAGAFVKFLDTDVVGCVNICTGKGISLSDYAKKFAQELDKEELLIIKQEKATQPQIITGDNSRLINEVGYTPLYTFDNAIKEIFKK